MSVVGEGESGGNSEVSFNEYDGFNRLIKVTSGSLTAIYAYNGEGLRISKTVNGVTTQHVWDGDQMMLELNGSGAVTQKYVRGINLIYGESGGTKKYYLFNGHGDVVQLTDASGTVTKNYDYDAFGNEKNADENDTNVFRYSGEYYDKETGTIYLRARYYDPTIGRFISEDSVRGEDKDPLSLNLYTYCANNPIIYVDPSGDTYQDLLQGMVSTLDQNIMNGFGGWLISKIVGFKPNYTYESAYDYYLGRMIGDSISIVYGAGMSIVGIGSILGSIVSGGAITVGTGGLLTAGGVTISTAGVATGTAVVTLGGTVVYASAGNMGSDFNNFKKAKTQVEASRSNLKKLEDNFLKKSGVDPHTFKKRVLKNSNVKDKVEAHYNIFRNNYKKEL